MKNALLILIHLACASILFAAACSGGTKSKLQGKWRSKDGASHLNITNKKFSEDDDTDAAEDYFLKGDTIYTSFQGNQPYTKFVIQNLDDHNLKLLYPDSVVIEFTR